MARVIKVPAVRWVLALMLLAGCARQQATSQRSPYTKPLSTPGALFGELPQVVQNTVRSEAGMAEIVDVTTDKSSGRVVYTIHFRNSTIYPPIIVAADGSVLNPDLTVAVPPPQQSHPEVKFNDLPLAVARVIQDRPLTPEIAGITRENWGDHTVYIFSFKDDIHNPKLYVVANGTVLLQAPK